MIDIAPNGPATDCDGAGARIDSRVFDRREINHETVIANSQAASVVTASANRNEEIVVASEIHALNDVCDIRAPRNQARFLMDHRVVDLASFVVIRVARLNESASEVLF